MDKMALASSLLSAVFAILIVLSLVCEVFTVDGKEVSLLGFEIQDGLFVLFSGFKDNKCEGVICEHISRIKTGSYLYGVLALVTVVLLVSSLTLSMNQLFKKSKFVVVVHMASWPIFATGVLCFIIITRPFSLEKEENSVGFYAIIVSVVIGLCGFVTRIYETVSKIKEKSMRFSLSFEKIESTDVQVFCTEANDMSRRELSYEENQEFSSKIYQLETQLLNKTEKNLHLKSEIECLNSELTSREALMDSIKAESIVTKETLNSVISDKEKIIDDLTNSLKEKEELIIGLRDDLEKQNALENAISSSENHQAALEAYEHEIESLKKQLKKQKNSSGDEDTIDIYRKALQEKSKEISVLLDTKASLEKQIEGLKHDIQSKNEAIDSMSFDKSSINTAITDYKDQIHQQKKDFESLKRVKTELSASHAYLLAENQRLKETIQKSNI